MGKRQREGGERWVLKRSTEQGQQAVKKRGKMERGGQTGQERRGEGEERGRRGEKRRGEGCEKRGPEKVRLSPA